LRILDGVEFIEAPTFTAIVSDYLEDDEYRALQSFLAGDPEAGDVLRAPAGFVNCDGPSGAAARASAVASGSSTTTFRQMLRSG
jgi:hypothetical protein